jgi:hypothetical protein
MTLVWFVATVSPSKRLSTCLSDDERVLPPVSHRTVAGHRVAIQMHGLDEFVVIAQLQRLDRSMIPHSSGADRLHDVGDGGCLDCHVGTLMVSGMMTLIVFRSRATD